MNGKTPDKTAEEADRIASQWYIPPPPRVSHGRLVYTLDFVLATLQGRVAEPEKVRRTTGWLLVGSIVRGCMAVAQVLIMVLAWIPVVSSVLETVARVFSRNAGGFFLRACYWKARLKHLGQDTIIDQYVDIWGARSVSIGSRCHIDTSVRLAAGERRHGQHGSITIGNHVHVGPGVHIAGRGHVTIEDLVGISANAHIYSATNVVESPADPGQLISMSHIAPGDQQHIIEAPVRIEPYAFISMMVRIMPGVTVGRGAVIHANTELRRGVPPFANIGGAPRGRQIGWRKPRRLSPSRSKRVATQAQDEITIREVSDPDDHTTLDGVADLHFDAFADGVTTQLGQSFVYRYYIAMIESATCSLWVAEREGRVVGFLGGTVDRHEFERINRSGATRLLALWRFATARLNPFAVFRALKKKTLSHDFDDKAELLSIVVSPVVRRAGLGKRFLRVWMDKLQATSLATFLVFTDNPEGLRFYEKYGGQCLFRFQLRSISSACFRFKIPPGAPILPETLEQARQSVPGQPSDASQEHQEPATRATQS
ncbi:MAG: GNAT family N-acetyltransferase [Phycisphaerae bacterium]